MGLLHGCTALVLLTVLAAGSSTEVENLAESGAPVDIPRRVSCEQVAGAARVACRVFGDAHENCLGFQKKQGQYCDVFGSGYQEAMKKAQVPYSGSAAEMQDTEVSLLEEEVTLGDGKFNCKCYLFRYRDLRKAFGTNCKKALGHWVAHGKKEGRNPACMTKANTKKLSLPKCEMILDDCRDQLLRDDQTLTKAPKTVKPTGVKLPKVKKLKRPKKVGPDPKKMPKKAKKMPKKGQKKHELGESAVKPRDLPHCISLLRTCRKQLVVSSAHLDKDPDIKVALDKAMAKPKKHANPVAKSKAQVAHSGSGSQVKPTESTRVCTKKDLELDKTFQFNVCNGVWDCTSTKCKKIKSKDELGLCDGNGKVKHGGQLKKGGVLKALTYEDTRKKGFTYMGIRHKETLLSLQSMICTGKCTNKAAPGGCTCYDGRKAQMFPRAAMRGGLLSAQTAVFSILQGLSWAFCSMVPPEGCTYPAVGWRKTTLKGVQKNTAPPCQPKELAKWRDHVKGVVAKATVPRLGCNTCGAFDCLDLNKKTIWHRKGEELGELVFSRRRRRRRWGLKAVKGLVKKGVSMVKRHISKGVKGMIKRFLPKILKTVPCFIKPYLGATITRVLSLKNIGDLKNIWFAVKDIAMEFIPKAFPAGMVDLLKFLQKKFGINRELHPVIMYEVICNSLNSAYGRGDKTAVGMSTSQLKHAPESQRKADAQADPDYKKNPTLVEKKPFWHNEFNLDKNFVYDKTLTQFFFKAPVNWFTGRDPREGNPDPNKKPWASWPGVASGRGETGMGKDGKKPHSQTVWADCALKHKGDTASMIKACEKETGLKAPKCISKFKISAWQCNTCCCKNGLVGNHISHDFLYGKSEECSAWFTTFDAHTRIIWSAWRWARQLDAYKVKCYPRMPDAGFGRGGNNEFDLGDSVGGRRGGGGMSSGGSFSFGASSNRAGNDEEDE